jgi:hypothetical protein
VTLEKIVPPVVPGAEAAAVLAIPAREMSAMYYGDQYGSLAVNVLP